MFSIRQFLAYSMLYLSATLIGYDAGYLNGVLSSEDFVQHYGTSRDGGVTYYLTPRTRAVFSSILVVGTVLGCAVASVLPTRVGRRGGILAAMVIYVIGVALQTAGLVAGVFALGRVFSGFALGFVSILAPAYLVECSSGSTRGRSMSIFVQVLTCGNVIACAISMGTARFTHTLISWRITIGFQIIIGVVIFLGALLAPESPVVLMTLKRPDEARNSIGILRNIDPNSLEVSQAIKEITQYLSEQASFGDVSYRECLSGTDRRRTLLGVGMGIYTTITGATFWFGYGTTFFSAAGITNSYLVSLILALVNCIFTGPSVYLIERVGRRPLLLVGGCIMGLTQLLSGVMHSVHPDSKGSQNMLIACAVIFIAAYASTWGAVGWVIMSEPFSERLRIPQASITLMVYWITTWLISFVVPYLTDATTADLGINMSYIWLGAIITTIVWAYFCVPELAGLSAKEVDLLFEEKVSSRRSVAWRKEMRLMSGIELLSGEEVIPVSAKSSLKMEKRSAEVHANVSEAA